MWMVLSNYVLFLVYSPDRSGLVPLSTAPTDLADGAAQLVDRYEGPIVGGDVEGVGVLAHTTSHRLQIKLKEISK